MGFVDRLLDRSIVFSFDRSGFLRHRRDFGDPALDVDLTGKVALVTGANSGLGFASSAALARRGADVHLLCRSLERGDTARRRLRDETGSESVHLERLDVSSLEDVRRFAERFGPSRVDVLVHNAGVLPPRRIETAEGLELTWATNVVGPYLLTHLLRPRLEAAENGRVVNVSSGGMYAVRLTTSDRAWLRRRFDGVKAYAETKRAEVVLTELWAKRLWGTRVTVNAMHPGWADTPSVRTSIPGFHRVMRRRLRTWEEGADTVVWLAAAPELAKTTGGFFFDRMPAPTHLMARTVESEEARAELWARCRWDAGLDEETRR